MKRRFGRMLALALCAVMMLSCVIQAGAIMPLALMVGDVDRDNDITTVDTTLIQRFLANTQEPSELQLALSDTDGDKELTVLDVTVLQRHLANLPCAFNNAQITDYVVGFTSFHANCEISIADHYSTTDVCYVGVPVTFYPKAYGGPRRYTLSVDGETVYEVEVKKYDEKKGLTYTFLDEGEHVITCDAECNYGQHTYSSLRVRAEKLPEDGSPVVMGAVFYDEDYRSSGDGVLTVVAAGGTAPYHYCYTLYYDGLSPLCLSGDNESEIIVRPAEYSTGYIDANEINVPELFAKYVPKPADASQSDVMRVKVTVRDAQGRVSRPVTASYIGYEICY
ncbi:MAG: hypothetical protein IJH40_07635 [Ruminococcus sp.]|uniref:dockerin type I repeat-containing protein n=1 Tax=Ruminococcus sp. TaxID=41978 RepID=UPI002872AE73|nr:dockerin type I domain-containing protein [Ruminococcus sp.]MBQ3285496.1 hypothetical protein [Ruminococcus sp.]